jgi:mono/diheme cytochrome c family protein
MRQELLALLAAAAVLAACTTTEEPAYVGDAETGKEVAQSLCASCHAIGPADASPNAGAPPLRHVLANYHPERLAKDLDRAVSISHLRMPTFYFGEHHAADVVAYLKTIQQPKPPGAPD